MPDLKKSLLSGILTETDLGRTVASFLVDRQVRELSPHTVDFVPQLHDLQAYLEKRSISSVEDTNADLLRHHLLDLGPYSNPGGVQCGYRALRAFFRWCHDEYEPAGWWPPIRLKFTRVCYGYSMHAMAAVAGAAIALIRGQSSSSKPEKRYLA